MSASAAPPHAALKASKTVTVAVRVRPYTEEEAKTEEGTGCPVHFNGETSLRVVTPIDRINERSGKTFTFDYVFWSADKNHDTFANQETVFDALGKEVLDNVFEGFNTSIFAYAHLQTPCHVCEEQVNINTLR